MHRTPLTIAATMLLTLSACSPSGESPAPRKAPPPPPAAPVVVAPAPAPAPPPVGRSFSTFLPSKHGFRFVNSFTGSPLPISLGNLEKYLNLPNTFGLCGGMSFAAADFFLAELEMPSLDKPPAKGDALYDYLYARQVDSLGESLAFVPKFAAWMNLPDFSAAGASFQTLIALPAILDRLESDQPTLLGLVLTSREKRGQLWENHQVLAYAADVEPELIQIHIYDPNYPQSDATTLRITPCRTAPLMAVGGIGGVGGVSNIWMPSSGVQTVRVTPGRRQTPVRGFFQMPYTPQAPPRNVHADATAP